MTFANVKGQRIYYEDTGGDKPAIVFSHGLLMDQEMLAPQVAALSGRYRCIIWDERDHRQTTGETLPPFTYHDSAIPLSIARTTATNIRGATLAIIPGGGHAANPTHPAPTNTAIEGFIESVGGTAE